MPTNQGGPTLPMSVSGNITASAFAISAKDGRRLLTIDLKDGSVTGSIEDASEAGKVFVETIRRRINPETDLLAAIADARADLLHLADKYDEQEFIAPTICNIDAARTTGEG